MRKLKFWILILAAVPFAWLSLSAQGLSNWNNREAQDWFNAVSKSCSVLGRDFQKSDIETPKAFPLGNIARLQTGRDILPNISDQGRVKGILDLVGRIARHEHLPFREDGQTFGNREKILPPRPRGYYREYTFLPPKNSPKTIRVGKKMYKIPPSYSRRGPERLVIGGNETVYYSPTHYADFIRLTIIP